MDGPNRDTVQVHLLSLVLQKLWPLQHSSLSEASFVEKRLRTSHLSSQVSPVWPGKKGHAHQAAWLQGDSTPQGSFLFDFAFFLCLKTRKQKQLKEIACKILYSEAHSQHQP